MSQGQPTFEREITLEGLNLTRVNEEKGEVSFMVQALDLGNEDHKALDRIFEKLGFTTAEADEARAAIDNLSVRKVVMSHVRRR